MKKIGIFSLYYKNYNCGGQLQSYALCKKLNELGYEAEQISHDFYFMPGCETKAEKYHRIFCNNFGFGKLSKRLKAKKEHQLMVSNDKQYVPNIMKERAVSYDSFVNKVPHSETVYTVSDVRNCNNEYDAFVVGSDQVWNPPHKNSVYLLNFLPDSSKKISYAASISRASLNSYEKKVMGKSLKGFDAISVREKEAVKQLTPVCDKKVEWVLDPTLLLTADQWDEVCAERMIQDDYIFCYFLGDDSREREIAKKYAAENGLKLVTFIHSTNHYMPTDADFGDVQISDISPEGFLSLIKHANYVFTDSFHASVFSYIYQKQFFVFARLGHKGMSSRIYTLLNLIECEERFCDTLEKSSVEYISKLDNIDYAKKREKFENMKTYSEDFLKKNLD